MNNTRYEDFCNRMRVYRKRLGYNQADIGKELGISQNDYSKRENGLIMISYDNLKKLQEIGMDIDELVSGKRDDICLIIAKSFSIYSHSIAKIFVTGIVHLP